MDHVAGRHRPVTQRALVIAALVLAVACAGRDEAASAIRPVSLPDLSKMSGSAQAQIREAHASLTRAIDNRSSAPAALADAYGKLGMLFMAADLDHAAEPCLLNAQTLAPTDARWPYYLGHLNRDRGELATA